MSSKKTEDKDSRIDPWSNIMVSEEKVEKLEFEDNFLSKSSIVPLNDSAQYLATLERKLANLKKGKTDQRREFLRAFEDTRNSYMFRVISSGSRQALNINQDADLETPVAPKLINSWLNPQQAVTVGELTELVKNDSVSANTEDSDTST